MRSSKKPTTHFWSIEIIRVQKSFGYRPSCCGNMRISKRKGQGNENESQSQRKKMWKSVKSFLDGYSAYIFSGT